MKNGRPKLGLSNLYWNKIDRKKYKPKKQEEEVLDEPIVMDVMEVDLIDRMQIKGYADTFCPPHLTSPKQSVILYTSQTTTEKNQ